MAWGTALTVANEPGFSSPVRCDRLITIPCLDGGISTAETESLAREDDVAACALARSVFIALDIERRDGRRSASRSDGAE